MNQMKIDDINALLQRILLILVILFLIIIGLVTGLFIYNVSPVDGESDEMILFEVKEGWGLNTVIEELEANDLIRNAFCLKAYAKLNEYSSILAGNYKISKSMSALEIIELINNGDNLENAAITVTFVEGKWFPYYVTKISETFGYTEQEIYEFTSNPDYLNSLIEEYWFITNEILNKDIYYPLEGYLFADTYSFKKSATLEEIFAKLLDQMDAKLSAYKEEIEISGKSIHSLLTMASMVELEAVTAEDRQLVAGVFYNRLNSDMSMGSDVTTYYASKKEMTESLYMSEINACNAYNTRGSCAKFPVGPICNASYSSITASITPSETDSYFFVADINNKVYFSKTNDEQLKVISELRKQNLWPE